MFKNILRNKCTRIKLQLVSLNVFPLKNYLPTKFPSKQIISKYVTETKHVFDKHSRFETLAPFLIFTYTNVAKKYSYAECELTRYRRSNRSNIFSAYIDKRETLISCAKSWVVKGCTYLEELEDGFFLLFARVSTSPCWKLPHQKTEQCDVRLRLLEGLAENMNNKNKFILTVARGLLHYNHFILKINRKWN